MISGNMYYGGRELFFGVIVTVNNIVLHLRKIFNHNAVDQNEQEQ